MLDTELGAETELDTLERIEHGVFQWANGVPALSTGRHGYRAQGGGITSLYSRCALAVNVELGTLLQGKPLIYQ